MAQLEKQTLIWCIDPSQEENPPINVIHAISALTKNIPTEIIPTYVLSPDTINWFEKLADSWIDQFLPWAKKRCTEYLKNIELKGLKQPQILVNPTHSVRGDVDKIIEYSKQVNATSLVVSTHARKGLHHFVIGSFAETLLIKTRIPVISINPDTSSVEEIKNILFPTDFSISSKEALLKLLPFAQKWNAQIHIVHKTLNPVAPIVESGILTLGGGWANTDAYIQSLNERAKDELAHLQEICESRGVKSHAEIAGPEGDLIAEINKLALQKCADMIALNSEANSFTATVVGSACREMIRQGNIPIWVHHIEIRK